VTDVADRYTIVSMTHVSYRLSSEWGVKLGGEPVSVKLTPQATKGFQLYRNIQQNFNI